MIKLKEREKINAVVNSYAFDDFKCILKSATTPLFEVMIKKTWIFININMMKVVVPSAMSSVTINHYFLPTRKRSMNVTKFFDTMH